MNRSTQIFLGFVVALAAIVGIGLVTMPSKASAGASSAGKTEQVARTDAVCQLVTGGGNDSSTRLTAYTPTSSTPTQSQTGEGAQPDQAIVSDLGAAANVPPRLKAQKTGQVASVDANANQPPGLGLATGAYAPGFTLNETVRNGSGPVRGLASTACGAPGNDFWYLGAGTTINRAAELYVTNSEAVPAQFDIAIYGANGQIDSPAGNGINLDAGAHDTYLISSFTAGPAPAGGAVAVHLHVRQGRVSTALFDTDLPPVPGGSGAGNDFIPAQQNPSGSLVISGLPGAMPGLKAELVLYNPGSQDTNVAFHLVGHSTLVPAKFPGTLVKAGQVTVIDGMEGMLAAGEPAALRIDSKDGGTLLAGMRLVLVGSGGQDSAYLAASPAVTGQAIISDNRTGGAAHTELYLTAPDKAASATVTTVGGGAPSSNQVQIPAGTTVAVTLAPPAGTTGSYAVIVQPNPGSGPVYGSRTIFDQSNGVLWTSQPLFSARETVMVPVVRSDLSGVVP